MHLQPFTAADAASVAPWATTPADALMWRVDTGGPVPVDRILACSAEDGVRPFTLHDVTDLVAYGELWIDDEEKEVEVARLIVAPDRRNQGIGRVLARELAARARTHYDNVFLRLRPENTAAFRCYRGAGFERVDAALEQQWNAPQPVAYVWMRYAGRPS